MPKTAIDTIGFDSVRGRLNVFGQHEAKVVDQALRCLAPVEGSRGALMPDGHFGYSAPIGAVLAYPEHVSPSGVGYDIGCGNKAVLTNLLYDDIASAVPRIMDRIFDEVSFGVGRKKAVKVDHPVIDHIRHADFLPQRALVAGAAAQLGTVGAGNHYVDLFRDEQGRVWIGVHFGSRGFGHKTASGFLALAAADEKVRARGLGTGDYSITKIFNTRAPDGEMTAPPTLLDVNSHLGESYLAAMKLAGEYAYAGRDVVVQQVLDILQAEALDEVHNHHNYAWEERHGDAMYTVVRKGATPALPGQRGFVGSTMGEDSVILEGRHYPEDGQAGADMLDLQEATLYSTVHGAGRAMSRTAAAGKKRKRWTCTNRDCDYVQGNGEQSPVVHDEPRGRGARPGSATPCPVCGKVGLVKRWVEGEPGLIDWPAVRAELAAQGVELRGAAADEAPGAYKRLSEVLVPIADTITVLHTLTPIGVAMAGPDVEDPFKD